MKRLFVIFLVPLFFAACTSSSSDTTASANKDSVTATAVSLPFKAEYSSDFVPGKPSDVAAVLSNYKAWQDNDMTAFKATIGDSAILILSNGMVIGGAGDSLVRAAKLFRDSLSKVELTFYAWTSNHSVDKNEDWVNVWYKEIDTYKTGKVDSAVYQDDNRVKDGKIFWTASHIQKLKK